jgi:uncharacterized protein (DUF934 family)
MTKLIRHRRFAADSWKLLKGDLEWLRRPAEDGLLPDFPQGDIIVPLALWQARREDLIDRGGDPRASGGGLGIWLDSHEDAEALAPDLDRFELVAVNFPQFADGRGYSIARLLRQRHGYAGELRAVGDVLRDQLYYLSRCGFDAFSLRADQDAGRALAALDDFSEAYQVSVERPDPLFRRRLATHAATPPSL